MTNRSHISCLAWHCRQSKVLEPQPTTPSGQTTPPSKSSLTLSTQPPTPRPGHRCFGCNQGVKAQTPQFTAFLTTIIIGLNLLQKGLLQSWQGLGVTEGSLQLQPAAWCRGIHLLNHATEFSQKTQACCKLSSSFT